MTERIVLPIHGQDHCPGGPDPIPCLTNVRKRLVGYVNHLTTAGNWNETQIGLDTWQNDDPTIFEEIVPGTGPDAGRLIGCEFNVAGHYAINIGWTWSTDFDALKAVLLVDSGTNNYPATPNFGAYCSREDGWQFTYPPVLSVVRGYPLYPEFTPGADTPPYSRLFWRAGQRSGGDRVVDGGFVEIVYLGEINR